MTLLEERLGLDDYIPALREGFQVDEKPSLEFRMASNALKSLLNDRSVLEKVLELLAHDIHFLREQSANLFNNEVVLWREPDGCFSLRMAIWTKGSDVFIHDHNALGVTGCWFGKLLVENWEIKEWLSEDKVKLELKEKIVLDQQYTIYVRPQDQGLHRVDLAEGDFAVSLSAYARPKQRGYIRRFDPLTGAVTKIYHPVRQQRTWAKQLLEIMEKS